MTTARLLLAAPLLASCAFAQGSDPDAGRADARERADGAPGSVADASASSDAAPVVDAAVGTPDAVPTADADTIVDTLVISEIVDATRPGGLPKFVEITNVGSASVALSAYSVGLYSNGNTNLSASSHGLSGSLAAGASFVLSFESTTFFSVYGENPDDTSGSANISGNDTVVLFRGLATGTGANAVTVDVYGQIGVDGSGQVWEYTDGFATRRQAATTPKAVFDVNDWGFSGPNALDGATASEIALATSPGTH